MPTFLFLLQAGVVPGGHSGPVYVLTLFLTAGLASVLVAVATAYLTRPATRSVDVPQGVAAAPLSSGGAEGSVIPPTPSESGGGG